MPRECGPRAAAGPLPARAFGDAMGGRASLQPGPSTWKEQSNIQYPTRNSQPSSDSLDIGRGIDIEIAIEIGIERRKKVRSFES